MDPGIFNSREESKYQETVRFVCIGCGARRAVQYPEQWIEVKTYRGNKPSTPMGFCDPDCLLRRLEGDDLRQGEECIQSKGQSSLSTP